MIEVATFKAAKPLDNPQWLGYPFLNGEILWVRFEGNSQEEVIKKANAWYDNEVDRQKQIGMIDVDGRSVPSGPYKKTSWDDPSGSPATPIADGWGNSMANSPIENNNPSTHGLAGSVWLIHHARRIKARFPADKVDAMLAEGFVRGGPRTQFEGNGGW